MKSWRVCGMVVGSKRNNTQISCVFHLTQIRYGWHWSEILFLSIADPAVCAIPKSTSWRHQEELACLRYVSGQQKEQYTDKLRILLF